MPKRPESEHHVRHPQTKMTARRHRSQAGSETNQGIILVDYDNLVDALSDRTGRSDQPHRFLLAMLAELRGHLESQMGLRSAQAVAFGDFASHPVDAGTILTDLTGAGVEARHVSGAVQRTDGACGLTLLASDLLHTRSDLSAFVILTGDNWYAPLVQAVLRAGRFALVAALDLPSNLSALHSSVGDAYLNARFLLDPRARETLSDVDEDSSSHLVGASSDSSVQERAPTDTTRLDDPGAVRALEVLEAHFGQYEEVYLTPLLRKLTESLDEEDGEPKDLVNLLQEAGVVWLEKRRGFPYDYTVLLVNRSHEDVLAAVDAMSDARPDDGYDDDDYDDDAFDDYDDEEESEAEEEEKA